MAKHADNAVKAQGIYELFEWGDGYWRKVKKGIKHMGNRLEVEGLSTSKLYWLHQANEGKEEMPFVLDENGMQHFPQLPILKKLNQIKQN